jgi:hypothetical protein
MTGKRGKTICFIDNSNIFQGTSTELADESSTPVVYLDDLRTHIEKN